MINDGQDGILLLRAPLRTLPAHAPPRPAAVADRLYILQNAVIDSRSAQTIKEENEEGAAAERRKRGRGGRIWLRR